MLTLFFLLFVFFLSGEKVLVTLLRVMVRLYSPANQERDRQRQRQRQRPETRDREIDRQSKNDKQTNRQIDKHTDRERETRHPHTDKTTCETKTEKEGTEYRHSRPTLIPDMVETNDECSTCLYLLI